MTTESAATLLNQLIQNRFLVVKLIGKGSFGFVFEGYDNDKQKSIAIKFEDRRSSYAQLKNEYRVYKLIKGREGIPSAFCYGTHGDYDYMVMQLLGPSLETLFSHCKREFSMKTVLMLGEKMLHRIEYIHQMSHVHRDLKPDNFVVNRMDGEIYLIDYGLARQFSQTENGKDQHIKLTKLNSFTGTARYASVKAQQQYTTSRRDDLESLGYILVYFLKKRLPWQQVPKANTGPNGITSKQRKERILEIKMSTSIGDICKGLPFEFQEYIHYCRNLGFEEIPSYSYLRRRLGLIFERNAFTKDWIYDWDIITTDEKKFKKPQYN